MSEPEIRLPNNTQHNNRVIQDCKWKIRTFVERDAYVGYDYDGGIGRGSESEIRDFHIDAINGPMRARSSREAWSRFTDRPIPELAAIPPELNLIEDSIDRVRPALLELRKLVDRITKTPRLREMAASKVLHLLRPNFVAIADGHVRSCLAIEITSPAAAMMGVQTGIRGLALNNSDALDELHAYGNSIGEVISRSRRVPVRLSKIRVLDILLWTDVAIHGPNKNQLWSSWYREEICNG